MSASKSSNLPAPHVSSNIKRVLSISSIVSVLVVLTSHVISRETSDESSTWQYLLQFVLISYSITQYLMYHAILYKLHYIFIDSIMPLMPRSVYSRTTLLIFSCMLPLASSALDRYVDMDINHDLINAIDTLSIILTVIITLSLTVPCVSRLWRLHVGQSNDILMAQSSAAQSPSCSKSHHSDDASILRAAIKLRAVLNDKQLKQIQCTNRMANLVIWGTITSLSTDLVMKFVVIDDIIIILGTYIMVTFIMCFCVYLMFEFSRTEYYRCCSCCDSVWSRCCAAASKRAITQSMMRELFWMLNGETSNEVRLTKKRYEDMKVAENTKLSEEAVGNHYVVEKIESKRASITSVPIDSAEEVTSRRQQSNSTISTVPLKQGLKSYSAWKDWKQSNAQRIAVDPDADSECRDEVMELTSPMVASVISPDGQILAQWYNGECLEAIDAMESTDVDEAMASVLVESNEPCVSRTVIVSLPVSPTSVPYTPQSTHL